MIFKSEDVKSHSMIRFFESSFAEEHRILNGAPCRTYTTSFEVGRGIESHVGGEALCTKVSHAINISINTKHIFPGDELLKRFLLRVSIIGFFSFHLCNFQIDPTQLTKCIN